MSDILELTAFELALKIRDKSLSAREAVEAYLAQAETQNPELNALITLCREKGLAAADQIDGQLKRGDTVGALAGIPLVVKDNISTMGIKTTCASEILRDYTPVYNATVMDRLEKAGAVVLGKANMDEFAMGASNETSCFGPARNPLNPELIPGGSSGGSAASVAARMSVAALGSDTGGSIRQPAACCGVTGLKPTYGRVSRYGLVAYASSLDQIGPITRDVRDAALMLSAIAGEDPHDATSSNRDVPDFISGLELGVKGLRVGLPREYFGEGLDAGVRDAVKAAARCLENAGAVITEVSLPRTEYGVAAYYIIATAEATSNLARYDGVKYGHRSKEAGTLLEMYFATRSQGFGLEVKRRIMLGNYVLSSGYYDAYYKKAQAVRALLQQDMTAVLTQCDLLLCPTMPVQPYRIGEKINDPLAMYLGDIYTITANLTGVPALTLPFGVSANMPVGVQLMGRPFEESMLLKAGRVLELGRPAT